MKLKKIASLMLAGVMAVSMLAGCSGKSTPNDGDKEPTNPVVIGAADAMNAVQSVVNFKDSDTLNKYLTDAVKKATYDQLNAAKFNTNVSLAATSDKVYAQLNSKIMPTEYKLEDTISAFTPKAGESSKISYLYLVDDVVSEDAALNVIAKNLTGDASKYPAMVLVNNNKGNKATYDGEVSIVKVSKSNEGNEKTASAYYVLVTVTQSVAKDASNTANKT